MADITTYSINGVSGVILGTNISVELVFGTDITALVADFSGTFTTVTVLGVDQVTTITPNDFTNLVEYVVSDDGITFVTYSVTVTLAQNTENKLLTFDIPSLEVSGVINHDNHTVEVVVTESTDVSAIIPEFTLSENASANVVLGDPIDITESFIFSVTSESGVQNDYIITSLEAPDHTNSNYTIYQMILDRLPFVADTITNKNTISRITLEVMYEVEPCFQIGVEDMTKIGKEIYYNTFLRGIIADIVSVHIICTEALRKVGGDNQADTPTVPEIKYIKGVIAGSVEVQYDQIKTKDTAVLGINTIEIITKYQNSAERKMNALGCIFSFAVSDTTSDLPYFNFLTSGRALW